MAAAWGGLIIGAVYMLRAVRNILHGPVAEQCGTVDDAPHLWRKLPFVVLLGALFVFGFFPKLLTEKIKPSAAVIVNMANGGDQSPKTPAGGAIAQAATPSETE
jgi:NADH-quinone oxidoreductase subunit M